MTLTDFRVTALKTPLKHPFSTALRTVTTIDEALLTLTVDTGLVGYGSASDTFAVTGDSLERIMADLERAKPSMVGWTLIDYEATFRMIETLHLCKSAQAALDIALHDLFAKEARLPLWRYLGGTQQRTLTTLYTISIGTPETMRAQALEAWNAGFTDLKIKLDASVKANIARLQTLARTLPRARFFLDPNQALTLEDAQTLIESVQDLPVVLLEQPTPAEDVAALSTLTAQKKIPILADETLRSLDDARRLISQKGCDLFNLKLMKFGGIYPTRAVIETAQKAALPCMMGSMLETGISVTAALHLCLAYDTIVYADLDGPTLASYSTVSGGIGYDKNHLLLDEGTGLGVVPKDFL